MEELKKLILSNVIDFDKFLREHFDFSNVKLLHENVIDYNLISNNKEFLSITLHSCAELEDYIFISDNNTDVDFTSDMKKYVWNGITLYMIQFIEEMD